MSASASVNGKTFKVKNGKCYLNGREIQEKNGKYFVEKTKLNVYDFYALLALFSTLSFILGAICF